MHFPASHLFHLAIYLGYLCPLIASSHSIIVTVWSLIFPNAFWWTSGLCPVPLLLQTVQRISLCIYLGVLVGEFFIGGLLLMSKHDRFRTLRGGCSGDGISVLRRAQRGRRQPAPASPLTVLTRDLTSTPKGEGFWAEPTWCPFLSSSLVPTWNCIHSIGHLRGLHLSEGCQLCSGLWLWDAIVNWWCGPQAEADILVEGVTNKETNK